MMDADTRTALRDAYLHVFDAFAIGTPAELEDAGIANNSRHGRELLATLTNAGLLATHDVNGEGDVWQVEDPGTYDDHSRAEAEKVIDKWLASASGESATPPSKSPTKERKPVTTTTEFKKCLCGCGENVPPKSTFRPGHDARMAGRIGRAFIQAGEIDDEVLAQLPTEQLRDKASGMFTKDRDKRATKAAAKAASSPPEPEPEPQPKPSPPKRNRAKGRAKAQA